MRKIDIEVLQYNTKDDNSRSKRMYEEEDERCNYFPDRIEMKHKQK